MAQPAKVAVTYDYSGVSADYKPWWTDIRDAGGRIGDICEWTDGSTWMLVKSYAGATTPGMTLKFQATIKEDGSATGSGGIVQRVGLSVATTNDGTLKVYGIAPNWNDVDGASNIIPANAYFWMCIRGMVTAKVSSAGLSANVPIMAGTLSGITDWVDDATPNSSFGVSLETGSGSYAYSVSTTSSRTYAKCIISCPGGVPTTTLDEVP